MKLFLLLILFSLTACGKNSSPEGRLTIKIEDLKNDIDSLKKQNTIIMDSLNRMREDLNKIPRR